MIRFLGLIFVFVIGLGAGAVWYGQMHHLRKAVPDWLPAWTRMLPDDAGILNGSAEIGEIELLPTLTIAWKATAPQLDGWHWDVTAKGEGIDLKGDLRLGYWPDQAVLTGGPGRFGTIEGVGQITLADFTVRANGLLTPDSISGDVAASLERLIVSAQMLGGGPVAGVLQSDGSYRATASLTGGPSPAEGVVTGNRNRAGTDVDILLSEPDNLPDQVVFLMDEFAVDDPAGLRLKFEWPLD